MSEPASPPSAAPVPLRLRALAGAAVADDVVDSASRAGKLTARAMRDLGPLLRACVTSPMTAELGQRLTRYCAEREVAEADLGHVLRVCKFLLREASASNAAREAVEQDAHALFGDAPELIALVGREYDEIRPVLRRELVVDALVKHGNVLDDIDWRIDVVATDRRAPRVGTPVALVTLALRNAQQSERVTVQLTSEQLQRLQAVFAALAEKTQRLAE